MNRKQYPGERTKRPDGPDSASPARPGTIPGTAPGDQAGEWLCGTDLRGALLRGVGLRRADLTDADLRGADLRTADLRSATLCGTDLRGADLRGSRLADADFRGARYDAATRWPGSQPPPGALLVADGARPRTAAVLRAWRWRFPAVGLAALAVDQLTKAAAVGAIPPATAGAAPPGSLYLTHVRNNGALFGAFAGGDALLVIVSGLFVLGLLLASVPMLIGRRAPQPAVLIGLALAAGGGGSNLVDRVRLGAVIDFIGVGGLGVFNVADLGVILGVGLAAAATAPHPTAAHPHPPSAPAAALDASPSPPAVARRPSPRPQTGAPPPVPPSPQSASDGQPPEDRPRRES